MSIKVKNITIKLKNFYQLEVKCLADGADVQFAYYVYKNGEVIEKNPYSESNTFLYNLKDPGLYRVRAYARNTTGTDANTSKEIEFVGFDNDSDPHLEKESVVIYGVNKNSAFIKAILETKYKVIQFIDEELCHEGERFFGLEIEQIDSLSELKDIKVVVAKGKNINELTNIGISNFDVFDYTLAPDNIVIETMYNMKSLKLYQISRFCYINSLIEEANFIRDFIQFKFNSYIPYTAELGEGTRFGYGGVGLIIHYKAKIGKNCVISQNVTIGSRGPLPEIGDNVFISPGAKCIGGKIGNNVIVGANAVVTKDIPDNCVVAGVPAKIIRSNVDEYGSYFNK